MTLKYGAETQPVIAKDVQFHPVTDEPVHFDLYRVDLHQMIRIAVPVHFRNQEASPGIKRGGTLNIALHEVEVMAPAGSIPEELVIDLTGLDIGDAVRASALVLPEGVQMRHRPDATVASVATSSALQAEEEEAEETAEAAEARSRSAGSRTGVDVAPKGAGPRAADHRRTRQSRGEVRAQPPQPGLPGCWARSPSAGASGPSARASMDWPPRAPSTTPDGPVRALLLKPQTYYNDSGLRGRRGDALLQARARATSSSSTTRSTSRPAASG